MIKSFSIKAEKNYQWGDFAAERLSDRPSVHVLKQA